MNATYLRYEIIRTLRNRQGFIFSLIFPVVMFFFIAGGNRSLKNINGTGIPAVTYYMVGMLAFGAVGAVLAGGARIAVDRSVGWNRQLRLSPLSPRVYLAAKIVIGYLTAAMTITLLYLAGISMGVQMPIAHWVEMTALVLVGLIPFAALGIWIGHSFSVDSMGPLMGGAMSLFALLGGSWFPLGDSWIATLGSYLPSYWVVQAGHVGAGGQAWPLKGWLVIAAWTAAATYFAARAYRADTARA
jgi:ABC-2 type transport system permease protein